jgi:CSLREA domain-containing protein
MLRPRLLPGAVVAAGTAILALWLCAGALATTIAVSTTADTVANDGQCSLREAITAADSMRPSGAGATGECPAGTDSPADTIVLGPGRYVLTGAPGEDANASGDLDILSPLTIQGASAATTIIDANHVDRVIDVINPVAVTLMDVTLTGGHAPDGAPPTGQAAGAPAAARARTWPVATYSAETAGPAAWAARSRCRRRKAATP